jgi:malto-oligosyltrehalose trehalohydrolase
MPFGAEPLPAGGVRFRLWAPAARRVEVELPGRDARLRPLAPAGGGFFEAVLDEAGPGARYGFVVDGARVPDPASRFQPEGAAGPGEVVDPGAFPWSDAGWRGRPWHEAVLYELHVGAFSRRGDYAGVVEQLDALAGLGVSAVELMPLAECPGRWNWGYDGVLPFAPASRHGRPEALKALVDAAHQRGLMVFLDVVYNHFGPEGNHLARYAPSFFTEEVSTPWGPAIDFTSRTVRDFFVHNALYWLEEYHMDGLRLDAVHAIHDPSDPDILDELARRVRDGVGREREVHLVLENDRNDARRLARDAARRPLYYTAQWNDDLHHCFHVLLTGEREGYYGDYAAAPARLLARCLGEGFAYQGEPSPHRGGRPRGTPSAELPPTAFVGFLQNHDQVGNRAFGERLDRLAPAAAVEAALAVLLLSPAPPLLFMGEERAAPQPFPFFCDFGPDLARAVREGRRREFAGFAAFRDEAARARIPDPCDPATFASAVVSRDEAAPGARRRLALCRALLEVRHREIAPRLAGAPGGAARHAPFGDAGVRVTWRLADGARLHLLAHLAAGPGPDAPALPGRAIWSAPAARPGAPVPPFCVLVHVEPAGNASA